MKITLADVRASRVPAALGLCATDARIVAFVNEAQERLLTKGKWYGTYGRFRICASDGCITIPPQLATIERAAICGMAVRMRDMWYEFLENGYGLRSGCSDNTNTGSSCCGGGGMSDCGMGEGLYRGAFPTFRDIIPDAKKLNFICDLLSDVGKEVLALGYDDNGNWIRTSQGGTIKDGEIIAFAQAGGTTSTNFFSSVTDVQLPANMDGQSWIYEYDTVATTKRLLSHYEYFETRPSYARYLFPSIRVSADTEGVCTQTAVDIIGKLEYIPVKVDTDYLVISSIPALKAMVVAICNSEKAPDAMQKAATIAAGYKEALAELDSQLNHYMGEPIRGVNIIGNSIGSVQPVPNLV